MSDLLTVSEVARLLDMPESAVRALLVTGQLEEAPFDAEMGVRVPADAVREYMAARPTLIASTVNVGLIESRRPTLTEARRAVGDHPTLATPPLAVVGPWADTTVATRPPGLTVLAGAVIGLAIGILVGLLITGI